MRTWFLSVIAVFFAASWCAAEEPPVSPPPKPKEPPVKSEADPKEPPVRSQPDPGLQDRADPKKPTAPRNFKQDPLDEIIVQLPVAPLHFKAEDEAPLKDTIDKNTVLEKLEYDITVDGVPAGKATIKVRRDTYGKPNAVPIYAISLQTRSNRAQSLFYDVDNSARSFIDEKGGFSRFFHMDRKEGKAKVAERITFNYANGVMNAMYERPRPGDNGELKWVTNNIPLTGKALDPLAAVYYLRTSALDLKNVVIGKAKPAFTLPVCSDRHVWNAKMYAMGTEHPDIGDLKNVECKIFEIDAPFRGLFERSGKVRIWVVSKALDDKGNEVPFTSGYVVKMTAEIPIGFAEAVLNLKDSDNTPFKAAKK